MSRSEEGRKSKNRKITTIKMEEAHRVTAMSSLSMSRQVRTKRRNRIMTITTKGRNF